MCHAVRAPGSNVTLAPLDAGRGGRVEQRIDPHRAGEPIRRSLAGRLRAASFDLHLFAPCAPPGQTLGRPGEVHVTSRSFAGLHKRDSNIGHMTLPVTQAFQPVPNAPGVGEPKFSHFYIARTGRKARVTGVSRVCHGDSPAIRPCPPHPRRSIIPPTVLRSAFPRGPSHESLYSFTPAPCSIPRSTCGSSRWGWSASAGRSSGPGTTCGCSTCRSSTTRDFEREVREFRPDAIGFSLNYLANVPEAIDLAKLAKADPPPGVRLLRRAQHLVHRRGGPPPRRRRDRRDRLRRGRGHHAAAARGHPQRRRPARRHDAQRRPARARRSRPTSTPPARPAS